MNNELFYMIFTPVVIVLFIFAAVVEVAYQKVISKDVGDYLDKDKKMIRNKYRHKGNGKARHKRNGHGMRTKHSSVESGGGGFGVVIIFIFIIILAWQGG